MNSTSSNHSEMTKFEFLNKKTTNKLNMLCFIKVEFVAGLLYWTQHSLVSIYSNHVK